MNAKRAKALNALVGEFEELQTKLEALRDEERDAYEEMSEKKKESEAGELAEEAAEQIEAACTDLDSLLEHIGEALRDHTE